MKAKQRTTISTLSSRTRSPATVATVHEPNVPECRPKQSWRVRYLENVSTKFFEIEIEFRRRDGKRGKLRIAAGDRSDTEKIRKDLDSRNARIPEDRKSANDFVLGLMRATPTVATFLVSRTGWCDDGRGFIMPTRMYGTAEGKYVWDRNAAEIDFGSRAGSMSSYEDGVLIPALQSPFVSFGILLALATPLLEFVRQRTGKKLLSETCIFHFAAGTSTGKTTVIRVNQSVVGGESDFIKYNATERAAAEEAHKRNDLTTNFDDVEEAGIEDTETFKKMTMFGKLIPAGKAKAVSRSVHLPNLHWSSFGLSTGPETHASLALRLSRARLGQQARFIDIAVPAEKKGGVFGARLTGAPRSQSSAKLIDLIDGTIGKNHGLLLDLWIKHLLDKDAANEVHKLAKGFVDKVAPGATGLELRVARKFSVAYAAGVLAVRAKLLPWPSSWPMECVAYCYHNALRIRDPEANPVDEVIRKLSSAIRQPKLFPRVEATWRGIPTFECPKDTLGFYVVREKKRSWYLLPDRLTLLRANNASMQKRVVQELGKRKLLVETEGATSSRQFRVTGASTDKVRAWRISYKRLSDLNADPKTET